jgi:hypothetical protein
VVSVLVINTDIPSSIPGGSSFSVMENTGSFTHSYTLRKVKNFLVTPDVD